MTEGEWVEKYVIPNCSDPKMNLTIPPGTPCSLGAMRANKDKTVVKIGQWEEKEPRNIEDLFGERNIYKWKIRDGLLVVHVAFYMVSDDEPATPKSGRGGKRKRRMSIQSEEEVAQSERGEESVFEDDASQLEVGDDLALEDDVAQLEAGDDLALEDDAAQLEGGDDLALEHDAAQSEDHTTPSRRRRRLPMPHKLSTVHPDNVDPPPEFNTGSVVKSEPGDRNARRSHSAVPRRSNRTK
ncbi:hypothetical protein E4U09_007954 [Claviceps aff. purpurea]|uniref:Uncharacterized protein n=1 Tax=Claviceps aff. purpurea TaxID=1967640 RepID=A0A9P7TZG1_9HYPO|nr:hypothetical protein E4U09_007954 [Claviceps aff. purpurea]